MAAALAKGAAAALVHYKMEGKPIPAFNFSDIDGNLYTSENTKGKIDKQTKMVIINKWNKIYLNDKKRVDRLWHIIQLYLRNGNFNAILKLFKSLIIKN